jgi:hypothetical protein
VLEMRDYISLPLRRQIASSGGIVRRGVSARAIAVVVAAPTCFTEFAGFMHAL